MKNMDLQDGMLNFEKIFVLQRVPKRKAIPPTYSKNARCRDATMQKEVNSEIINKNLADSLRKLSNTLKSSTKIIRPIISPKPVMKTTMPGCKPVVSQSGCA